MQFMNVSGGERRQSSGHITVEPARLSGRMLMMAKGAGEREAGARVPTRLGPVVDFTLAAMGLRFMAI